VKTRQVRRRSGVGVCGEMCQDTAARAGVCQRRTDILGHVPTAVRSFGLTGAILPEQADDMGREPATWASISRRGEIDVLTAEKQRHAVRPSGAASGV
jgi:hypothetical protein